MKKIIAIIDIDDADTKKPWATTPEAIKEIIESGVEAMVDYEEDGKSDTWVLSELIGEQVIVGNEIITIEE